MIVFRRLGLSLSLVAGLVFLSLAASGRAGAEEGCGQERARGALDHQLEREEDRL